MESLLPKVSWKNENVVFRVYMYNNCNPFSYLWSITVFLGFLLQVSRPLKEWKETGFVWKKLPTTFSQMKEKELFPSRSRFVLQVSWMSNYKQLSTLWKMMSLSNRTYNSRTPWVWEVRSRNDGKKHLVCLRLNHTSFCLISLPQ